MAPNGPSCHWGGVDGNEHMGALSSNHTGGGQVAMADGSVHFINQSIDVGNQAIDDIDTRAVEFRLMAFGVHWEVELVANRYRFLTSLLPSTPFVGLI